MNVFHFFLISFAIYTLAIAIAWRSGILDVLAVLLFPFVVVICLAISLAVGEQAEP